MEKHQTQIDHRRSRKGFSLTLEPKFSNASMTNLLSFPSTTTEDVYLRGCLKEVDKHYSERIIEDLLSEIFAEQRGYIQETSSACGIVESHEPELRVDKRLKYWRQVLAERRQLQSQIETQTGKKPEEVLFNRRTTLEDRNKETVKRILDYAERMRPENLTGKRIATLTQLEDPCTCAELEQVRETWPQAERVGHKHLEISGLPGVTQKEILGSEAAGYGLRNTWLQSKFLDKRLDHRFGDITKVVEFLPNLNKLQVTGTNYAKLKPKPNIEFLGEQQLHTISSTPCEPCSEECVYESYSDITEPTPPIVVPQVGMSVNGKDYVLGDPSLLKCADLTSRFKCDPFQRRTKHVLRITNIGKQTLSFSWKQGVYFYNRASLLVARDGEFFFDTSSFRLVPCETYNLVVMYQPRKVGVAVELWHLNVEPPVLCCCKESLQLRFYGKCTAPREYLNRLNELRDTVIWKSNLGEMENITQHQASLVPLIGPSEVFCPYDRTLDERELFNVLNFGYNCVRFDDLETLKTMHKQLKKPREPHWDLRLETIKGFILRIENREDRSQMFETYMEVLLTLQGSAPSLEAVCQLDAQKQQTRLIYVRGVICNGIEDWEDLMSAVEETFFKPELQRYYIRLLQEEERKENDEDEDNQPPGTHAYTKELITKIKNNSVIGDGEDILEMDGEKITAEVLKKLRHSKYFRDALYIHTYTHVCDIVENIVSVIESTEIVPT